MGCNNGRKKIHDGCNGCYYTIKCGYPNFLNYWTSYRGYRNIMYRETENFKIMCIQRWTKGV
jgi:hypothetical protein